MYVNLHKLRTSYMMQSFPNKLDFLWIPYFLHERSHEWFTNAFIYIQIDIRPFRGISNRSSVHSLDACFSQANHVNVNPLYFMIPTTVGCSYAFMLPVSTPPNSIAFASGHLMVKDMVSYTTKDSLRKLDSQTSLPFWHHISSCRNLWWYIRAKTSIIIK